MKRNAIKSILALTLCVFSLGLAGCGNNSSSGSANGGAAVESNESSNEFATTYSVLYNDDEELSEYVPVMMVSSARAEAMMQVSGYSYKLIPGSDDTYEFVVEMTCGTEDSDMYMKRTIKYTGTYSVEGSVYTLEAPTNLQFDQETAGQFAAESGEGGADFWGPNGLSFDETYTNDEAYSGVSTGASLLENMESCKVTVDGNTITSFEALN